jgi:hypothetical protein
VVPFQYLSPKNYTAYLLKADVFEIHFAVTRGDTPLSSGICHEDKKRCSVFRRRGVHRRAPLWLMLMEYTYEEYGGMRLTPVAVIAGLVLHKRHTHYVFLVASSTLDCFSTMEVVFSWDKKCKIPATVVNADRPRTLRTPVFEDAITAAMERESCSPHPHDIARELGLFQPSHRSTYCRSESIRYAERASVARRLPWTLLCMQLGSPHGLIMMYSASFYSGLLSRNINVLGHMLCNVVYLFFNEGSHC